MRYAATRPANHNEPPTIVTISLLRFAGDFPQDCRMAGSIAVACHHEACLGPER